MKQTAIKIIVGLLLIWLVFGVLGEKLKRFIMPAKTEASSSQMIQPPPEQQSNMMNAQIKSTMRRIENKLSEDELAGCMVTDQGCSCYNKGGKVVKVSKQQCQNYTKDSSGHRNKIALDNEKS